MKIDNFDIENKRVNIKKC